MECPYCNGRGWYEGTGSGHTCNGTEEDCAQKCPVPIPIQIRCPECCGSGVIDPLAGLASGTITHEKRGNNAGK